MPKLHGAVALVWAPIRVDILMLQHVLLLLKALMAERADEWLVVEMNALKVPLAREVREECLIAPCHLAGSGIPSYLEDGFGNHSIIPVQCITCIAIIALITICLVSHFVIE